MCSSKLTYQQESLQSILDQHTTTQLNHWFGEQAALFIDGLPSGCSFPASNLEELAAALELLEGYWQCFHPYHAFSSDQNTELSHRSKQQKRVDERSGGYLLRVAQQGILKALRNKNRHLWQHLLMRFPASYLPLSDILSSTTSAEQKIYQRTLIRLFKETYAPLLECPKNLPLLFELLKSPARDLFDHQMLVEPPNRQSRRPGSTFGELLRKAIVSKYGLRNDQLVPSVSKSSIPNPPPFTENVLTLLCADWCRVQSELFFNRLARKLQLAFEEGMVSEELVRQTNADQLMPLEFPSLQGKLLRTRMQPTTDSNPIRVRQIARSSLLHLERQIIELVADERRLKRSIDVSEVPNPTPQSIVLAAVHETDVQQVAEHYRRLQQTFAAAKAKYAQLPNCSEEDLSPASIRLETALIVFAADISSLCSNTAMPEKDEKAFADRLIAFVWNSVFAVFRQYHAKKNVLSAALRTKDALRLVEHAAEKRVYRLQPNISELQQLAACKQFFLTFFQTTCNRVLSTSEPLSWYSTLRIESFIFEACWELTRGSIHIVDAEQDPLLLSAYQYWFERELAGLLMRSSPSLAELFHLRKPAMLYTAEQLGDPIETALPDTPTYLSTLCDGFKRRADAELDPEVLLLRFEGYCSLVSSPYQDFLLEGQYQLNETVDQLFALQPPQVQLFDGRIRRLILEQRIAELDYVFHGDTNDAGWLYHQLLQDLVEREPAFSSRLLQAVLTAEQTAAQATIAKYNPGRGARYKKLRRSRTEKELQEERRAIEALLATDILLRLNEQESGTVPHH